MRHLSSGPIFTLTKNHKIFLKSHYLSFSTQTQQNPSPGNYLQQHPRRQEDEDRRLVPISVWWDFENCNLPLNSNVFKVGQCITNAVRANRINGPIKITAFGDVMQISRTNQEALSATGITLIHVPSGGKNSADRSLLVDLMYWVSENPPPAHIFLISGDRDFASVLHRLRMSNYNILLASHDNAPSVLCCAATIMWQWSSLLSGENLTGKLFNQPPDGHFNSWYGRYKAPLEDPYAVSEQSLCVNNIYVSEESVELVPEPKIRRIPKAVRNHICQILDSYPEGIAITNLRAELFNKGNLMVDKDLYGYKKFARFLLAMPNILNLRPEKDGQFSVHRVGNKYLDEPDGEDGGSLVGVSEKTKLPLDLETKVKALPTENLVEVRKEEKPKKEEKRKEITTQKRKTQEVQVEDKKVNIGIKDISEENELPTSVVDARISDSEPGVIRRVWLKLFGSGDKKGIAESGTPELSTPSSHKAPIHRKNGGTIDDDVTADVSGQDAGFFDRVMSWFKFSSSREVDGEVKKNVEKTDNVIVKVDDPNWVEMFSKESFWKEMHSFMDTQQGSAIFPQSLTREHLAAKLQRLGPLSLNSLSKPGLLHLVDLLISEKKWVEECSSRAFPFRSTLPSAGDKNPPPQPNSNGLSQMFAFSHPADPLESGEKKLQNPPHTGVPQPVPQRNPSFKKTRSEIIADCQKLVDHIVKEHPEGFFIGAFRKLFLEKNGYALDLQKLGYEKLVNLLQIMPGVRTESNLMFPTGPFKTPNGNGQTKYDNDSTWAELGPVNSNHDYEPVPIDDFSEDEESGIEANNPKPEDDTSLLQILDSWYSNNANKDCDDGKKGGPPSGCVTDKPDDGKKGRPLSVCVTDKPDPVSQPSAAQTDVESGIKSEPSAVGSDQSRKHKRGKSYTFVSDHADSKDMLVEGIMDSLKKTGEGTAKSRVLG